MTALCKLVATHTDSCGYITYVFSCLEMDVSALSKYIMCTRYPNWHHRDIKLGEVGYLSFEIIEAGVDEWFDGNKMIPYKYDAIQFIKFVKRPEREDYEYIM